MSAKTGKSASQILSSLLMLMRLFSMLVVGLAANDREMCANEQVLGNLPFFFRALYSNGIDAGIAYRLDEEAVFTQFQHYALLGDVFGGGDEIA